jgi:hypothetical protein
VQTGSRPTLILLLALLAPSAPGAPPKVLSASFTAVLAESAPPKGDQPIPKKHFQTHFEYGSPIARRSLVPNAKRLDRLGIPDMPVPTRKIEGLVPGAEYHFRVVITIGGNPPVNGPDIPFVTTCRRRRSKLAPTTPSAPNCSSLPRPCPAAEPMSRPARFK